MARSGVCRGQHYRRITYSSADLIVRWTRRAHRTEDEAHHQFARLDYRYPQVEALAVFDDDAFEDVEAQYRAILDAGQSRMASVLGDKSMAVTRALSMVTLWKVLSDLKWVEPGSPVLGAFIGAGIVIAIGPDGRQWLANVGVTSQWCARSTREGKTGAEELSVLEGAVLVGTCSRLLDNPALVRWMSREKPQALLELHAAAKPFNPPGTW